MTETRVSGDRLEVGLAGPADRPLLVLTRMASRAAGIWDPLVECLASHFRVASYDLRMPDSERLDDPGEVFRRFARECCEVADRLGHARFAVVGWNGGSHVALRAAVDVPERLLGCVLIGAFHPLPDMRPIQRGVDFMRAMLEHAGPELYAYYWFMSGLSPRFVAERFDEVTRLATARARTDRFVRTDMERLDKWIRALRGQWVGEGELAAISTPVLVLQPALDRWHAGPTVEMGRALAALVPGARLEVLEGVGSLAPLEIPAEIAQRIVAHLAPGDPSPAR